MATLIIPNSFTANTAISSSEMNANFSAITTLINSTKLNSDNIQTSGIATANLADASVTRAKLASGALKDNSNELSNLAISASVASSALTVALKGKDGSDPSSSNIVLIGFRSSTATSGVYVQRSITSAVSVTVSSGSTLGHVSGKDDYIYVYAIDNAGTVELAVSTAKMVDEGSLVTTTAEGGAGAADSRSVIYSTTARSNVAVRLIGRLKSNQVTAGTWAAAPTEVSVMPTLPVVRPDVSATYSTAAGQTIADVTITIVDFGTSVYDPDSLVTTGASWKFTAPSVGRYCVSALITFAGVTNDAGTNYQLYLYKNGSNSRQLAVESRETNLSVERGVGGTTIIDLAAGDYIDVRIRQNSSVNRSLTAEATQNHISIFRIAG